MSNKPPIEVPQGAIRLNTDSQKLEFFAQDRWYEMATDVPTLDGGARAVSQPSTPSTNVLDFITIPTAGNAQDFGDAATKAGGRHGAASRTRGLFAGGGTPTRLNSIEFITFSSTGNGTNFGDLTQVGAGGGQMGLSNQTRGVFAGRTTPGNSNTIDFVTIASTGDAVDFGDQGNNQGGMNCFASPTRGIMGGAHPGKTPRIEFITISTTGNSQEFGDLIDSMELMGSSSSATRGVWMGGRDSQGPNSQHVQYIQIQTLGKSIDFGQLIAAKDDLGGCSDSIRALAYGGGSNVIEYFTLATGGDAVDFGDGQTASGYTSLSNGHGGL